MLKSKYPDINKELLKNIKETYIPPIKDICYYDDHETTISVERDTVNPKIIIVTHKSSFNLYANTTDEFPFPKESLLEVHGLSPEDYYVKVKEYMVNNVNILSHIKTTNEEHSNDQYRITHTAYLSGSNKYAVEHVIEKRYSIEDNLIGFRVRHPSKGMRVKLECPEDMKVCFLSRGTIHEFKPVTPIKNDKNTCEYKYKGLVLPQQGYVFSLKDLYSYTKQKPQTVKRG
jgi:hypothetical protein